METQGPQAAPRVLSGQRLENPFYRWKPSEVQQVAEAIVREYELPGLTELFVNAASLICDPLDVTVLAKLSDEEKLALEMESIAGFWDQPWPFQTTCLMLFMGAIVQGWSQTGTNGANLTWPLQLGLTHETKGDSCGPARADTWAFAAVNAAAFLAAGLGAWTTDLFVTDLFLGRRGAIFFAALLIMAASIGGAFVSTWQEFLATRLILGWGMGCKATVIPVFTAEIAPARLRGTLVMNWQFFVTVGIVLGFCANLIASLAGESAWRWQIASTAVPSFALLSGVFYVHWDSPRFLMKHEGRYREQYKKRQKEWKARAGHSVGLQNEPQQSNGIDSGPTVSSLLERFRRTPILPYRSVTYETLLLLRGHPILAAKELIYAHVQLLVEQNSFVKENEAENHNMSISIGPGNFVLSRVWNLVTKDHIRRALYAAVAIMVSQQLCGVNALVSYSSTLFCSAGVGSGDRHSLSPLILSVGLGLLSLICTIPAFWWIESGGRRFLALATIPLLSLTMAGAAASSTIVEPIARKVVVVIFAFLFEAAYSPGLGPVPFTLAAEVFPLEERIVGMSVAVSVNLGGAGLLTLLVPQISQQYTILAIFAGLNVLAFALVWVYVREVAGSANTSQSLEELFYIFDKPTLAHIKYQLTKTIPYVWSKLTRPGTSEKPDSFQDWDYANGASM